MVACFLRRRFAGGLGRLRSLVGGSFSAAGGGGREACLFAIFPVLWGRG